jgi:hypothetical protein
MEIFTGGEDVLTFVPRGVEDEDAARQETDYLTYQIFQKNRGWMTIYSGFKDALLSKVGRVQVLVGGRGGIRRG